jgi:prevent-host-death family protein
MKQVNIHEAKTQLSKLIALVEKGEEIVIARAGKPVARLVHDRKKAAPSSRHPKSRIAGALKGKIWIADDFDAPLPDDILDAFEGKTEPPGQ